MAYVITSACIGTKDVSCAEVCCPVDALYPEDQVPEAESAFIERNAAYYRR